jgi:Tol biopolymer transport system component
VTGPGGIGKSRLAWELEKYLDGLVEPISWHHGRSPPDGSRILFQSPPEPLPQGEQNIYTINQDGTELTQLTAHMSSTAEGAQGNFHPSYSPDGSQIVFSHFPGPLPDRAALYLMNADGSAVHLLAASQLDENAADWGQLPSQ